MGRRSEDESPRSDTGDAEDEAGHGADLGLVFSLSLLAGGLVSYPSLSAVAEGKGDLIRSITLFLVAMLVAMIGFGTITLLFRSFSEGHHAERARNERAAGEKAVAGGVDHDGHLPRLATERLDNQPHDIDEALAATDSLLHENHRP